MIPQFNGWTLTHLFFASSFFLSFFLFPFSFFDMFYWCHILSFPSSFLLFSDCGYFSIYLLYTWYTLLLLSAGHGNLFQESYTKVMEHTAKDVFASVGLIFEARNYAMGATASAAEMSMCFSQIFGDDVDIFSWDYGMLEARDYLRGRYLHYVTRGLLSRNPDHFSTTGIATPAFVALQEIGNGRKHILSDLTKAFLTTNTNNDDKKKKKKKDNNSNSDDGNDDEKDPPIPENNGLALFLGDEYLFKEMKEAIPETLGMSGAEIKDLPPYVRNFKCNNALENGDPYCGDEKYSTEVCPKRMGMASWHPGWKYQAMVGNSMALFLVDQLVDAVQTIDDTEDDELEFLLERLVQEEQQYYTQLLEGPLPEFAKVVYWYNNTDDHTREYPEMTPTEQALLDVNRKQYQDRNRTAVPSKFEQEKLYQPLADYETWFRGPSMCHTARLPAQTRYTGAVSNTRILNGQDPARYERIFPEVVSSFDVGTEDAQLHQQWEQNYTAKYGTSDEEEVEERRWNRQRKVRRLEPVDEEDDDNRNNINHPLQLSYVMNNEREQYACPDCATVTRIDYRDFFYVDSFVDGWSSFTFPNDVEQVQYRYQQNRDKFKGILVLVFRYVIVYKTVPSYEQTHMLPSFLFSGLLLCFVLGTDVSTWLDIWYIFTLTFNIPLIVEMYTHAPIFPLFILFLYFLFMMNSITTTGYYIRRV